MLPRAQALKDRAREAVPEGTFAVGAGLLVAAITAYVFIVITLRTLGKEGSVGFSAFWALIFVTGPGVFLPIEQEVGRALAHRRARGIGGGPLVRRAARLGGGLAAIVVVAALVGAPALKEHLFHGEGALVVALALGMLGFFAMHITRGTLAGNGRFRAYGEMLGTEGVVRLAGAVALVLIGVSSAGPFGFCMGLAPFVAVAVSLRKERGLLQPGPPAPYSELSEKLGFLLGGSVLFQFLGYASLLAIGILAKSSEKQEAEAFVVAFFVARIPVLLFQAVQGTLLPKLAGLAGAGRHDDFRTGLVRLMYVVVGIAVIGTVAAFTIGPFAGKLLFGAKKFTIGNADLGLLAAGSGVYITALTLAQALIALDGHAEQALAWLTGVIGFFVALVLIPQLFLRVELGFLIGSALAGAVMIAALARRMRNATSENMDALVTALETEPLEL